MTAKLNDAKLNDLPGTTSKVRDTDTPDTNADADKAPPVDGSKLPPITGGMAITEPADMVTRRRPATK